MPQTYNWPKMIKYNKAGRNIHGQRTIKSKGRAIKNFYPIIINKYKNLIPGQIVQFIWHSRLSKTYALIHFVNGKLGIIPAVQKMQINHWINTSTQCKNLGSFIKIKYIKPATFICNIEINKNSGAQLIKAPGTKAKLLRPRAKEIVRIRLPSAHIIYVNPECFAQLGKNGNPANKRQNKGTAGLNRKIGQHPKVRGIAMNPNSHPHGGNSGPGRSSVTPWGKSTK